MMQEEKTNTLYDVPLPVSIHATVKDKVLWAETCFKSAGAFFLAQSEIGALLNQFKSAAEASSRAMADTGIVALCRACDEEEGGSCCGKGLENRYDAWLLLINRLLGVQLPHERQHADGCYFLGDQGCLLTARDVICINYVCQKITRKVAPSVLNDLREIEGEEINLLFRLNETIKKVFKKWMNR